MNNKQKLLNKIHHSKYTCKAQFKQLNCIQEFAFLQGKQNFGLVTYLVFKEKDNKLPWSDSALFNNVTKCAFAYLKKTCFVTKYELTASTTQMVLVYPNIYVILVMKCFKWHCTPNISNLNKEITLKLNYFWWYSRTLHTVWKHFCRYGTMKLQCNFSHQIKKKKK